MQVGTYPTRNFATLGPSLINADNFENDWGYHDVHYNVWFNLNIYLSSKWGSFFLLQNLGFLLTTVCEFEEFDFNQNLANFKKESFSFNMKSELEKKILKKLFFINEIDYYSTNFDKIELYDYEPSAQRNIFFRNHHFFNFFFDSNESQNLLNYNENFGQQSPLEEDLDLELAIRRVRFKPGYSIIWREARQALKDNLSLKFRYQHRLTKYILKFRKIIKRKLLIVANLTFFNLALKTRFLPDFESTSVFFNNGLFCLNASPCINQSLQLFVGDIVQLIVTNKYYSFYKMSINQVLRKRAKFNSIQKKKSFIAENQDEKSRTNNFPSWLLKNKETLEDIPKFLEVDFYTLSCVLIYEPFLWSDYDPSSILEVKFGVINMYNWKYIN